MSHDALSSSSEIAQGFITARTPASTNHRCRLPTGAPLCASARDQSRPPHPSIFLLTCSARSLQSHSYRSMLVLSHVPLHYSLTGVTLQGLSTALTQRLRKGCGLYTATRSQEGFGKALIFIPQPHVETSTRCILCVTIMIFLGGKITHTIVTKKFTFILLIRRNKCEPYIYMVWI